MKIAVYSNYCGNERNAHANVNGNMVGTYPHFFYTNNGIIASRMQDSGWQPRILNVPVSDSSDESCMQAKEAKIIVPEELREFDIVVFRDAKMGGLDLAQLPGIIDKMRSRGMWAAFPVHARGANAEYDCSMGQLRYKVQAARIRRYMDEEFAKGGRDVMPIHFGCNLNIRNMRHQDTAPACAMWMEHTNRVGLQDQISFHFVAQYFPMVLPIGQEFGFRKSEVGVPE